MHVVDEFIVPLLVATADPEDKIEIESDFVDGCVANVVDVVVGFTVVVVVVTGRVIFIGDVVKSDSCRICV